MYNSLEPSVFKTSSSIPSKSTIVQAKAKASNQFSALSNLQRRTVPNKPVASYNMYNVSRTSKIDNMESKPGNKLQKNEVDLTLTANSGSITQKISAEIEIKDDIESDSENTLFSFHNDDNYTNKESINNFDADVLTHKEELNATKNTVETLECEYNEDKAYTKENIDIVNHNKTEIKNIYFQNTELKAKCNSNIANSKDKRNNMKQFPKFKDPKIVKSIPNNYSNYHSYKPVTNAIQSFALSKTDIITDSIRKSIEIQAVETPGMSHSDSSRIINKPPVSNILNQFNYRELAKNMNKSTPKNIEIVTNGETEDFTSLDSDKNINESEFELNEYMNLIEHFSDNGYAEPIYKPNEKILKLKISVTEATSRNRRIQSELLKNEFIFDSKDMKKYSTFSYTEDLDPEYLSRHNATFKKTNICHKLSISGKKVVVLDVVDKSYLSEISTKSSVIVSDEENKNEKPKKKPHSWIDYTNVKKVANKVNFFDTAAIKPLVDTNNGVSNQVIADVIAPKNLNCNKEQIVTKVDECEQQKVFIQSNLYREKSLKLDFSEIQINDNKQIEIKINSKNKFENNYNKIKRVPFIDLQQFEVQTDPQVNTLGIESAQRSNLYDKCLLLDESGINAKASLIDSTTNSVNKTKTPWKLFDFYIRSFRQENLIIRNQPDKTLTPKQRVSVTVTQEIIHKNTNLITKQIKNSCAGIHQLFSEEKLCLNGQQFEEEIKTDRMLRQTTPEVIKMQELNNSPKDYIKKSQYSFTIYSTSK